MPEHRIKLGKVPGWPVVFGLIMLCGVLSMAYGFYRNNETVLYVGLAVSILGAFNGILFLVIRPGEVRIMRQRH